MASVVAGATTNQVGDSWEYNLRKYLLLLATMVGTITYTAAFTPPGGVWQDSDTASGHLAGDPILRDTSYRRYLAFFYTNAAAFASSLVVIVLVLILSALHDRDYKSLAPLHILRFVMVLDLFSLMAAYVAGTCRDILTTAYSSVLVCAVFVYVIFQMALAAKTETKSELERQAKQRQKDLQKQRKMLMVLATFAVSVTYLAGLSAPGGFWNNSDAGNRPGTPVLKGRHDARLAAFFIFNTTAFIASLLVIVALLDKKLRFNKKAAEKKKRIPLRLYTFSILVLIGLMGAYATGSCRQVDTSFKVSALVVAAVLVFLVVLVLIITYVDEHKIGSWLWDVLVETGCKKWIKRNCFCQFLMGTSSNYNGSDVGGAIVGDEQQQHQAPNKTDAKATKSSQEKARSLVLLLATLAATIAYQAGLDPPGGLWEEDGVGYLAGDPILLSTNPRRYKAFFYCNSIAFVASLLAIILVKWRVLLQYHALEAAMILDLFGLIGAYAAGSCRDLTTSIYAIALAGAVLVYVVIHVVFFTLDHEVDNNRGGNHESVEKMRKRLLLFAILAATISYQAGLTPPSGFRLLDDMFGHRAGDPVLLYNYPRRYKAFFYCNSVSFMLSISLIILLVNPNLYRPAIRSHALSVCTAAGMLSLVGAYAAGSTQHLKTSIYIFSLVVAVLIVIVAVVLSFAELSRREAHIVDLVKALVRYITNRTGLEAQVAQQKGHQTQQKPPRDSNADIEDGSAAEDSTEKHEALQNPAHEDWEEKEKLHKKRKYVMLLGILAASVTYQAGLKPPGGIWQSDGAGHAAGNPVMHDNRRVRYQAFFYINSVSLVASVIVIILLLVESLIESLQLPKQSESSAVPQHLMTHRSDHTSQPACSTAKDAHSLPKLRVERWQDLWFRAINTTVALDLLGLLLAYAVGSSRSWKTSGYVLMLVIPVLAYVGIHVLLSLFIKRLKEAHKRVDTGYQQEQA